MSDDAKVGVIKRFSLAEVSVGSQSQTAICLTLFHSTEFYEAILDPDLARQIGKALCDAADHIRRDPPVHH